MKKNINKFEIAILTPLVFFDIFDRPLQKEEIWQGIIINQKSKLKNQNGKQRFEKTLQELTDRKIIQEKDGWYFLKNREKIIQIQKKRKQISIKYLQKAKKVARILKHVPFVRMISAINSVSFQNCKQTSDIDLFIITSANRLWIARALILVVLQLFGLKISKNKQAGQICTAFIISEKNLNLESIALKPDDIYFCYWFLKMKPLYGEKVYQKFINRNRWTNAKFQSSNIKCQMKPKAQISKNFGDYLNQLAKKYQVRHLEKVFGNKLKNPGCIVKDEICKIYTNDQRAFYQKEFEERMRKINCY